MTWWSGKAPRLSSSASRRASSSIRATRGSGALGSTGVRRRCRPMGSDDMAVATYGGQPIFGGAAHMLTVDNPRAGQVQRYFGSSDVAFTDGGLRGRFTFVSGVVFA